MTEHQRRQLARLGAPAAFLLAFTIFVLIVRSGMGDDAATTTTTATTTQATTRAAPPSTTAPATTATTTATEELYEIQSGDTLETIAAEHGTTVDALIELNPGIDPRSLTVGDQIRIR